MIRKIRRIAWPLSAWSVVVPAVLILGTGFALTVESFAWRPEWQQTSAFAHEHLSLVAPIAAASSYYRFATLAQASSIFAASRLDDTPQAENRDTFFRVWLVSAVAYTLALLPIFVVTARTANYGQPDLSAVATGYIGLAFAVAFGQLLANVLPHPVFTAGAAVAMFLVLQLPQTINGTLAAALPVQWDLPRLNEYENPIAVAFRCLALLSVAVAMVIASRVVGRVNRWGFGHGAALGAVLGFVLMLTVSASYPPVRLLPHAQLPARCEVVQGMDVCVHVAHLDDLAAMTSTVGRLVEAYGKKPEGVSAVIDRAALPADSLPGEGIVAIQLNFGDSAVDAVSVPLADTMAGYLSCLEELDRGASPVSVEDRIDRAAELGSWLRYSAGVQLPGELYEPAPESFFGRQSLATVQSWISSNEEAIADCRAVPGRVS